MNKLGNEKVFQDAVLGLIKVEPLMIRVIDTPEFQRLRFLHQNGVANLVFPSASHSRFEHSIGTYHLARRLLNNLRELITDESLRPTKSECISVKLAALCHDLGHGPYSHFWEHFIFSEGRKCITYKHETLSCSILQRIYDKDEILQQGLNKDGVMLDLVKALIMGEPSPEHLKLLQKRVYIFEIMNNTMNGMDIDKWEYMMRDCFQIGLGYGNAILELDRFIWFYRPAFFPQDHSLSNSVQGETDSPISGQWHMSFRDSEIENVFRCLTLRLHLHRQVYSHKTLQAIETMLVDALDELDPILKYRDISNACLLSNEPTHLSEFLKLTDISVWSQISGSSQLLLQTQGLSAGPNFERAFKICERIMERQLYINVGCIYVLPWNIKTDTSTTLDDGLPNITPNIKHCTNKWTDCTFLPQIIFEKDTQQKVAIPIEYLGSHEIMLQEIFASLPTDSIVKGIKELRLWKHTYSSNSTKSEATFYFYSADNKTFTYKQTLSTVIELRLFWTGGDNCSKCQATPPSCLVNAFYSWRENKQDLYLRSLSSGDLKI